MTFSLVARDPATGSFGIAISSSSPAVASRCVNLRTGVGAAASQNVTNPALGFAILEELTSGASAQSALDAAIASEPYPEFRQATVIDAQGRTAVHSGGNALGLYGHAATAGAVAAGNMLATPNVPQRLLDGYVASPRGTLEERLLDGLLGAVAEGGEAGPVRSAGLVVVDAVPWRTTDLRVDDHDDPIRELARLLELWLPQKADYLTRALHPGEAPRYGVPGDA